METPTYVLSYHDSSWGVETITFLSLDAALTSWDLIAADPTKALWKLEKVEVLRQN